MVKREAFCETCMRSDSPLCFCDISFTSFITFFLHNFSIINFDGPIHLHYIYGDLESSVSCNWKKKLQQTEKTVCVVSICSMFLYLFALWVFAAWFCICSVFLNLFVLYFKHDSVFVCAMFASCFCICLCCEYLQHVSVYLFALYL